MQLAYYLPTVVLAYYSHYLLQAGAACTSGAIVLAVGLSQVLTLTLTHNLNPNPNPNPNPNLNPNPDPEPNPEPN